MSFIPLPFIPLTSAPVVAVRSRCVLLRQFDSGIRIKLFAAALLLASAVSVLSAVRYVDVNSANPAPPYVSWATAATNIQDAVDAALAGDEIVVTNGIYAMGGRAILGEGRTNRVAVDEAVNVRSVNGPGFTAMSDVPLKAEHKPGLIVLPRGLDKIGDLVSDCSCGCFL